MLGSQCPRGNAPRAEHEGEFRCVTAQKYNSWDSQAVARVYKDTRKRLARWFDGQEWVEVYKNGVNTASSRTENMC